MTRPRRGLSVEEALQRWTDPEAWAEVEALFGSHDVSSTPHGKRFGPRLRATPAFKRVCGEFQRKLLEAELIVSATHEQPDPTNPRFVVDPDLMRSLIIRMDLNQIVGPGVKLCSPEIFTPDEIPLNVDPEGLPRRLRPAQEAKEPAPVPVAQGAQPEFRHDADYSHVWVRGREYSLTPKQARVVEVLHDAYLNRASAWMKLEDIRAEVDFDSASLHQLFRRLKDWKGLIRSDRRGGYRLNIGDYPQAVDDHRLQK